MSEITTATSYPNDLLEGMVTLLELIRNGRAGTRQELVQLSGLGRTAVTTRINELIDSQLVTEAGLGPSIGGRQPRQLRFRAEAGVVLVADIGATSISVGSADLSGRLLVKYEEPWNVAVGGTATLERVQQLFDQVLRSPSAHSHTLWGIGIGVPGPVEFATGRPISPPIMPGWDDYHIREQMSERFHAPVWVDNDANVMALGELRAGAGLGERDIVFIKIGTGIGSGLVSGGRLHRGAQGSAGDIGHVAISHDPSTVCRCGKIGCLEALAGGAAIAREALDAARSGRSALLAKVLASEGELDASDVGQAAQSGDAASVEIVSTAGYHIGQALATVVSFFNPSVLVIGGGVSGAGDGLLAAIRHGVYQRSLPLATRDLRILRSTLGGQGGMIGAAFMVLDQLFQPTAMAAWLPDGSPSGHIELPSLICQ